MSTPRYSEEAGVDRPLFGNSDNRPIEKFVYMTVGFITTLIVIITVISSFIFHTVTSRSLNSYFGVCIVLACVSNIILLLWYHRGDMSPKFRFLIYYNSFVIFLLCICANLYFHGA